MSNRQFSVNKILPPAPGKVLFRDRLFSFFDQPCPQSFFLISGPEGSEKNNLGASCLSQRNITCLWRHNGCSQQRYCYFIYCFDSLRVWDSKKMFRRK